MLPKFKKFLCACLFKYYGVKVRGLDFVCP